MFFMKFILALLMVASAITAGHGLYAQEWWAPFGAYMFVCLAFVRFLIYFGDLEAAHPRTEIREIEKGMRQPTPPLPHLKRVG